ncbi:hypothetical protein Q8F55_003853 [Vanrija albida]|uniref:BZIP domain-containing protein n=1 Tax=Vanrija albida TaxID=181172 RepID=A0ABR3Q538_9TREE
MQRAAPLGGGAGGPGGPDDGDNRSRNAKAQRRHREKRKAHLKMLEESVQVLQAQLEEARRQLSNAAYGGGRIGYSPEPKNVGQMAQENAYLRDENADLRRQLYALRAGGPYPDPSGRPPVPLGSEPMSDVKTESATPTYGVYPAGTVVSPPRMPSSSHGRTMSHPGDFVRDPAAESGSASSTSSYPPPLYQFGTIVGEEKGWGQQSISRHPQRASSTSSSRSRMLSTSSAPSASPYVTSAPFPTDPRAHALSTPTQAYPPVRYESVGYPAAPPPHNLPRSAVASSSAAGGGLYTHGAAPTAYVARADGDVAWGPDVSSVAPTAPATATLYAPPGAGAVGAAGVPPPPAPVGAHP